MDFDFTDEQQQLHDREEGRHVHSRRVRRSRFHEQIRNVGGVLARPGHRLRQGREVCPDSHQLGDGLSESFFLRIEPAGMRVQCRELLGREFLALLQT